LEVGQRVADQDGDVVEPGRGDGQRVRVDRGQVLTVVEEQVRGDHQSDQADPSGHWHNPSAISAVRMFAAVTEPDAGSVCRAAGVTPKNPMLLEVMLMTPDPE
jgi:hypothetical protein